MDRGAKLDRRSFLAGLGSIIATLSIPGLDSISQVNEVPDPNHPTGRFGDIDEYTTFDVCIIGSGFAGSVLGNSLVKHGFKTIILESGPDPRKKSIDPRFQQLEVFRSSGPIDYPVASTRFRGVGGTSWLWGGNCTRLHPMDFEKTSYTPPEASWPITYTDLQPYYEQAERTLRVRGGKHSEYHPPKRIDYPLPPDRDVSPLQSMLSGAGVVISDTPFSTPVGHDPSILSGKYGPFLRMAESHLPSFQASPYGALIPEVTCTRLLADEKGRILGTELTDLDRNVKVLRARVYVVACGGLESPRLLLLSHSRGFPEGIGNNHGWVGRCFMEHRPTFFTGRVKIGSTDFSVFQLKGFSYQFYKKFKEQGLGGMRLGFHLDGATKWKNLYGGEITTNLDQILTRRLQITIDSEMKPCPENRVTLDREVRDYFGNPVTNLFLNESEDDLRTIDRAREIVRKIYTQLGAEGMEELPRSFWAHHHMGTCRMGDNPRTSVVDRNLRVHGTRNLFVAGSSVFVTSGAAHPTLSLTALSLRLSDYLSAQLQNGAFPVRESSSWST
jgi:glucose dehydrogenase